MFVAAQVDIAQIITSLAGLVTAAGWAYAQYRGHGIARRVEVTANETAATTKQTQRAVTTAAAAAAKTQRAVGDPNGRTLTDALNSVEKLDKYTHDSVHEINGTLTVVLGRLDSIDGRLAGGPGDTPTGPPAPSS